MRLNVLTRTPVLLQICQRCRRRPLRGLDAWLSHYKCAVIEYTNRRSKTPSYRHHHNESVRLSGRTKLVIDTQIIFCMIQNQRKESDRLIVSLPTELKEWECGGWMIKCVTCSEKLSSRSVSIRPSRGRRYSLDLKVLLEPWETDQRIVMDGYEATNGWWVFSLWGTSML